MNSLKYLVVVSVALAVVAAVDLDEQLERDEIIEAVNSAHSTWKAGRNFDPSTKKSYIKYLTGVLERPGDNRLPALVDDGVEIDLPIYFDARQKWRKCISLKEVRDQGPCGSCWAVSAAATFTDRLCIASNTTFNDHLSAEQLLSCCKACGGGCYGGDPTKAWQYFQDKGIVTGGDYHSHEGCQPYTLPACEHYVHGRRKNCSTYNLPTPHCKHECYNKNYKVHNFKDDHHKVKSTFSINLNVTLIQKEIYKHGPVETAFTLYEDFVSYKSGVYQHITGLALGGHAVKVIGWGVENKTAYWLVANTWNTDWGDQGFFKIRRGNNECLFEKNIRGGYPDV